MGLVTKQEYRTITLKNKVDNAIKNYLHSLGITPEKTAYMDCDDLIEKYKEMIK